MKKERINKFLGYIISILLYIIGMESLFLATKISIAILEIILLTSILWIYTYKENTKKIKICCILQIISIVLLFLRIVFDMYYSMVIGQIISISTAIWIFKILTKANKKEFKDSSGFEIAKMLISSILIMISIFMVVILSLIVINPNGNEKGEKPLGYDKRIEIWGENIPGNSKKSKLEDMKIEGHPNYLITISRFFKEIRGNKFVDIEATVDTFTYTNNIQRGYENETYEDVPYLIPYTVENSDRAVIIIPGGGYGYKSIDMEQSEGQEIAKSLNDAGISAYILWYRSNPYEEPIQQLDVQRAVRYLRFHSSEMGINPDKISLMGFSVGGNQIGNYINLVMGNNKFPQNYVQDEVDEVSDEVTTCAMIYPMLTYEYNVPCLFASFNSKLLKDEYTRNKLMEDYDLSKHVNSENVKQFICYGTNDFVVDNNGTKKYIEELKKNNVEHKVVIAEGQGHGVEQKYYMNQYLDWIMSY